MIESLGTTVVMDAPNMKMGDRIMIGEKLCEITKIEGENVFFTVVVGWSLVWYQVKRLWKAHRVTAIATIIILTVAYIFYFDVDWSVFR